MRDMTQGVAESEGMEHVIARNMTPSRYERRRSLKSLEMKVGIVRSFGGDLSLDVKTKEMRLQVHHGTAWER